MIVRVTAIFNFLKGVIFMPGRDGTGPFGQGPGTGGGAGMGSGRGGRGRMGGQGVGPGGECVCPSCGTKIEHKIGVPCYEMTCPKCGTKMVRG